MSTVKPRIISGLPVIGEREPVYTHKDEFKRIARVGKAANFVRTVSPLRTVDLARIELTEHLDIANKEFILLGTIDRRLSIIPYEWCLIPAEKGPEYQQTDLMPEMPPGFILGARVENVRSGRALQRNEQTFINIACSIYRDNSGNIELGDVNATQALAVDTGIIPDYVYVDIDPILRSKR